MPHALLSLNSLWLKTCIFKCLPSVVVFPLRSKISFSPKKDNLFEEKMTKFKTDRRSGVERREFQYTVYIPERRSGIDRRCEKNGNQILWIKYNGSIYNRVYIQLKGRRIYPMI